MNKRASRLQVGENTVLSFVTAASLGAEYVEFGSYLLSLNYPLEPQSTNRNAAFTSIRCAINQGFGTCHLSRLDFNRIRF